MDNVLAHTKGPVKRATLSCNLLCNNVALQVEIVCCAYYHLRAQQIFILSKSKNDVYFLQHENMLHAKAVIRTTNNLNLQCNIVARQVAQKCCPYYWALTAVHAKPGPAWSVFIFNFFCAKIVMHAPFVLNLRIQFYVPCIF